MFNKPIIFAAFAYVALASFTAQASLIVGSDASWMQSTTTTVGGVSGAWTNPILAPPSAATFTQAVTLGGGVSATGATALGVTDIFAGEGVNYFRTTFNLDAFSSILASVSLAVDNNAAVWINGMFVAAETTLTRANWSDPLPSFDIRADGVIINIVKFDQVTPFTGFTAGTNELILSVRNLDGNDRGGFGFRMDIDATAVPEPSIIALFGLGLAGLGFARRKTRSYI
jgi:hypothetical protein